MLRLPSEVNVSQTPYKKLLIKIIIVILSVFVIGFGLSVLSVYFISLEQEQTWFRNFYTEDTDITFAKNEDPLTRYLRNMTGDIDPSMVDYIYVQCDNGDFDNAMATLGGKIVIGKTLLNKIGSENELFFILAHEIAHVHERHVIRQLAFRMPFLFIQTLIGQDMPLSSTGDLIGLDFSRRYEKSADIYAINALIQHYGHVGGVEHFFNRTKTSLDGWQDYFGSHPSHSHRLDVLSAYPQGEPKIFRKELLEQSCVSGNDIAN